MTRRPVLAAVVSGLALLAGAGACGSSGGPTGPAAPPPPRVGAVEVDPAAGPIGTVFTLTALGLKEGEAVAFEITFPGEGKAFPGAALTVPADGMATTTYRATTANQPGDYLVRLTGPPGSLAEGRFTVRDGPPLTTTIPDESTSSGPSTSGRTGTTSRRTTTTVKGASTSTSTSTTKGPGTTSTTRRTTTSASTSTTVR